MKKTYLVVTAMDEELEGLFKFFPDIKKIEENLFYHEDEKIAFYSMKGGIGKVSMAYMLGSFLAKHKVDEIVNVGVAGSINPALKPFMTLIASKTAYHDVDVTAFGYEYGQMAQCPKYFAADEEGVKKLMSFPSDQLMEGLILSGDSFITKTNLSKEHVSQFDHPLAVDMESAAVSEVCYLAKIPFLIIRTISDDTSNEDGNKDQYENNLTKASYRAGELVAWLMK